jgi:hypothetical protein
MPENLNPATFQWKDVIVASHSAQDIAAWPITSAPHRGEVYTDLRGKVAFGHSKSGRWPSIGYQEPPGPVEMMEGSIWTFAKKDGEVYGAEWDRLKVGQTQKDMNPSQYGETYALAIPGGFTPVPGQVLGYMVSTPARWDERTINERSPIVFLKFGTDEIVGIENTEDPIIPPPETLEERMTRIETWARTLQYKG